MTEALIITGAFVAAAVAVVLAANGLLFLVSCALQWWRGEDVRGIE